MHLKVEYGHAKLTPNNKIDDVGDLVDDLESDWSDSVSDTSEPFVITNNGASILQNENICCRICNSRMFTIIPSTTSTGIK